jgi:predicted RecA/RadA family phage recombinase
MAVTETNSGTQSATISTEHTLATITTAGVYQLRVDTANMANGDRLVLRAKTKTLSGGTSRQEFSGVWEHVQADKAAVSNPCAIVHEVVFTLQQTAGTGRSFPWSVLKL